MKNCPANPNSNSVSKLIEETKQRCEAAAAQIQSLPPTKLTDSCKLTLLRSINSELKFLTRLSTTPSPTATTSFNIGYIESVLHILHHPLVSRASRVCKPSNGVHVDIVCTLDKIPVWFIVSDRNPNFISWSGLRRSDKGLKLRVERVLAAAKASPRLKPDSVLLFLANGVDEAVAEKLGQKFGAFEVGEFGFLNVGFCEELDGDWVGVHARSYVKARTFRIRVNGVESSVVSKFGNGARELVLDDRVEVFDDLRRDSLGEKFCSLVLSMRCVGSSVNPEDLVGEDVVNFDTTALIAIVSGISNGGTGRLLATPESELKERFKGNYEFVIAQVMSEIQKPILEELTCLVSGKIGMVCESVRLEFRELVSMCGGPNEKMRAEQLLKCLLIVPDCPSARMMDILTTRKIAWKNKLVFGTGDQWLAPTLTANMGFVRAISQTGMSLSTLEHRPRALTGD